MREVWKKVPGTDYEASSTGRLRRYVTPHAHTNGYLKVKVGFGRKSKSAYVHRLVAAAFLGACPKASEVHHRNARKKDNRPANLVYVSHQENIAHMTRAGVGCIGRKGERSPTAKLKDRHVAEIKKLAASGVLQTKIAAKFKVSTSHVSNIINGISRCS